MLKAEVKINDRQIQLAFLNNEFCLSTDNFKSKNFTTAFDAVSVDLVINEILAFLQPDQVLNNNSTVKMQYSIEQAQYFNEVETNSLNVLNTRLRVFLAKLKRFTLEQDIVKFTFDDVKVTFQRAENCIYQIVFSQNGKRDSVVRVSNLSENSDIHTRINDILFSIYKEKFDQTINGDVVFLNDEQVEIDSYFYDNVDFTQSLRRTLLNIAFMLVSDYVLEPKDETLDLIKQTIKKL